MLYPHPLCLCFVDLLERPLVAPIDPNLLMRRCSSLYDFNLLQLPAAFSSFLIARKSPARPHVNPHPFSTLPLCSRPSRRLGAWLGDNRVIPPPRSLWLYLDSFIMTPGRVLVADLSKHKRYEIRLSVYNAVGEGPVSAPQEVFVGEAGKCLLPPTTGSAGVTLASWILVA